MTNPTDRYIHAATRENTRKSYRAAIEHYESVWGGYLPATADSVALYLAHYAPTLIPLSPPVNLYKPTC